MSMKDRVQATIKFRVEKFMAKDGKEIAAKKLKPYEVVESTPEAIDLDVLLHEGVTVIMFHIAGVGASENKWDNTNARIGIGDDNTAPADTQTGLQAVSNKLWKGMNGGYPQKSGDHDLLFQADFIDGEAEYAWNEETIVNDTDDAGDNLCRQNTALGTKPAGQTWRVTGTVTIS